MYYDFIFLYYNLFRPLEVIMDSDVIMIPNKRSVHSNEENIQSFMDVDVENMEPSKSIVGLNKPTVFDSCVTQVPSSQDISKENDLSNLLQNSIADKNKYNTKVRNSVENLCSDTFENGTNNLHSDSVENTVLSNKRKISNVCSISNNEDNDLFDYMDVDEFEELPTKKPKIQYTESIIQPIPTTSFNIENEQPTYEKSKPIQTVDPLNIMTLLADVRDTGQFIDSDKLPDKSVKI